MQNARKKLFARLDSLGISTRTVEHPAVFTVEDAKKLRGQIEGGHCKNLFLKDKKGALWLIVCLEDASIDLKNLPGTIGSARISFGKPELLRQTLAVEPGSVTPFALINDTEKKVNVILDRKMMSYSVLNFHPLENTATTSIKSSDLVTFIESCGITPQVLKVDSGSE